MPKTILLTGGSGFTGQYIKAVFEENNYKIVELTCDLTDKPALNKCILETQPTGVIHLAALSFVAHPDPLAFYEVNVIGTLNLLDALKATNCVPEKIIIASSANVYGTPAIEKITEETNPAPMNHYAMSKLAMEHMVKLWFDQFNIIITRPFNYTGIGQDPKFLVPKIVSHFKEKRPEIELGNIDVYRDFSDVRDVAASYLALYESPIHSEVINICSGQLHALKDIISMMETIAGYKITVNINPDFVRAHEIQKLGGDYQKFRSLTHYIPQYTLTDTLNAMYHAI